MENSNGSEFNKENENKANDSGYTVTPEGGYYTRSKNDIIQDEPNPPKNTEYSSGSYTEGQNNYSNQNTQNGYGNQNNGYTSQTGNQQYGNYGGYNPNYNSGYNPNFNVKPPKPPRPPKQKKAKNPNASKNWITVLVCVILAAAIGAGGGATAAYFITKNSNNSGTASKGNSNVNITVEETAANVVEAVAEKAANSVVGIRTTTSVNNFFFGKSDSVGSGSGVVYTSDGYIITNYHVIEEVVKSSSGGKIEVFIGDTDSTSYKAEVVGYSISTDLAVIKIDAKNLVPIELANSDELKVGQFVVAMGSPGGLDFRGSVTYGIVSGLNRVVSRDSEVKLIQTDAAINPGNSGGALLDVNGRLVGINSSKIVSNGFEGMGFSIPVNTVKEKCDKIINKSGEPEPYIGINISKKYTKDVLSYYDFPNGAVVVSVNPDSPAEKAGIQRGDIITEYDGKEVKSPDLFEELMSDSKPGKNVKVKFYRSGHYYSTDLKVESNN